MAAQLNDLYRLDPAAAAWTAVPSSGPAPSPRDSMGFAAAPDGVLYVFGGEIGGYDTDTGGELI